MKERKSARSGFDLLGRLAAVEQYLQSLRTEFENAEFRENDLVKEHLQSGFAKVSKAVSHYAEGESQESQRASSIAWLHAYFARSIFDAETTEHYLGESDFLELAEPIEDWRKFVDDEFAAMEKDILELRNDIQNSSNGTSAGRSLDA